MSVITCTRKLTFCAAHRVYGHENKCAHIHGHNYTVYVTAQAEVLDGVGRVVDFSVIKIDVGGYLDRAFDHGTILWVRDPLALDKNVFTKLTTLANNPTAENIADHILHEQFSQLHEKNIIITEVVVWETENCYATAKI